MARRSTRVSSGGNSVKQHKRALSNSTPIETKVAKRPKRAKSTPTKSEYFSASDVEAEEDGDDQASISSADGSESNFEDAAADDDPSASPDDDEDEEDDNSDDDGDSPAARRRSKSRKAPAKNKTNATQPTSPSIEWKPGVKTGLGPGTQVIIKKPKARPAGKIPYADDTIHPHTLLFLEELRENNKREWLKLHDPDFRQAEKDWQTFVEKMTETLTTIDDTIPELPVKDVIFRIYRDVRFSKDPTPYKAWFSVAWSRAGRKGPYAHYYIQCAPGKSFVGGGLWHPDAAPTAAMRRAIDRHPRRLKDILLDTRIRKEFLKNAPANDNAVVKAYVDSNRGNMLKTKPKGYDGEHPDIDLLRLRNYTIGREIADEDILGESGRRRITELLTAMQPYITYLNSVVMPDGEEESSESEEADREG